MQLRLGGWTLTPIETGYLWLDGGSMFGSVPKPLWSKIHPPDDRNRIRLAMRCLLAEGHGRRVLVDDGIGDKFPPKLADIYRVEQDVSRLETSLAALGLAVTDVTDVVGYDVAAIETMDEKQRLLAHACDERAWVLLEHDPEIAWAIPRRDGDDFAWAETVTAAPAVGAEG